MLYSIEANTSRIEANLSDEMRDIEVSNGPFLRSDGCQDSLDGSESSTNRPTDQPND